jgi:hypothetical protein
MAAIAMDSAAVATLTSSFAMFQRRLIDPMSIENREHRITTNRKATWLKYPQHQAGAAAVA